MSSVEYLQNFVNERLSAAAEEIFGVFKKTIFEYEEEINRQRRLLDIVWKPKIKLHRIELPQQHVCKEEVLWDQQLCIQERSSSLDPEDPEPPQINEEQEELCTSQEGEQLEVKQETETFMLTPTCEESDHSEDERLHLCTDETQSVVQQTPPGYISVACTLVPEPNNDFMLTTHEERDHRKDETLIFSPDDAVNLPVITSMESAPRSDHELLSHSSHEAESQDHKRGRDGDSGSTRNTKPKVKKRRCQRNSHPKSQSNPTMSNIDSNTHTDKTCFQCHMCEKAFRYKSHLQRHLIIHTGEKPFSCDTCGKRFSRPSSLTDHMRIHTGEKPYSCITCGRDFRHNNALLSHMRKDHTAKPFSCRTCGKGFKWSSCLALHVKSHSGGEPYTCNTCGKNFTQKSSLNDHVSIHTGEKPYPCKICGRDFRLASTLLRHMITHTGERPHSCATCGKRFSRATRLKDHMRIHTGEKPYSCEICGVDFRYGSGLVVHMRRAHAGEKTS